jgi:multiple sugar transport system substrate-binding protein
VTLSRRALALRLLGGGLALSGAGAARAQTQRPAELVVASFPSFDDAVRTAMPLYKKLHPEIKLKLVSLSYDDHHNALVSALATGVGLPDVLGIEVDYLGKFVGSAGLEDLSKPPYSALQHKAKLVPYTFGQASTASGVLSGLPADVAPSSLFLRKDIIDKAGVSEAELTQSWESYIEAGKCIKARTGMLLLPHAMTVMDTYIRAEVQAGQGLFFDTQGRAIINTPRFQRGFELAKAVRVNALDGNVDRWTNDWFESLRRSVATEISGAWMGGHLASYIAPDAKGLWRVSALPAGAFASWGGSFYAIPSRNTAARKQAAWEFIRFMCTDREMQIEAFKKVDAFPALLAAADDPFIDEPLPYFGGQRARQLWRDLAKRVPVQQVNRLDASVQLMVRAELDKVLLSGKDIPRAIADAQRYVERRVRA